MRRSHPLTVWTRVLALGGTGICFLHRVAEMGELLDSIEWQSVEALNQNPSHPVSNALKQVRMVCLRAIWRPGRAPLDPC